MIQRLRSTLTILFGAAVLLASLLIPTTRGAVRAAGIDPGVYDGLAASPDGQAKFIVLFTGRADLSGAERIDDWAERGRVVMEHLMAVAYRSQSEVLARLAIGSLPGRITAYQPFWIANAIAITGDRVAVEALARMPGVAEILPPMKLDAPEQPQSVSAPAADDTWGIEKIGADQVWAVYGKKGEGMVVGIVDTGVQWDHTSLRAQYRGWNGATANHNYHWWDPSAGCAFGSPCDPNGHGTHTTGTAVGGNSAAQGPIGVAPGSKWSHALGCCPDNAALLSALQWMAAPTALNGANADPSKRPNVVNNSWGGPGGSKIFYDVISNLRAAGIVPVFSAGNSGSACGTLGSPGDNIASFNVGNTTLSDGILSSSSRGSNPFTGATGPEVSAPGTSIYSSTPGNTYSIYSGTSMAAPHVAGSVALLMSVEPELVGKVDQVEEILRKTAVKLTSTETCGGLPGSQAPNNAFGWGRIDVKAAADFVANAGRLSGTVTDAGTGLLIANTTVSITRNTFTLTQKTGIDGSYSFTTGAGTYTMEVKAFGYNVATAAGVSVSQDVVTDRDFALTSLNQGTISGLVREGGDVAKPVAGATVELLPISTGIVATVSAEGSYTLSNVPFGTHTIRMRSPGYQTLSSGLTVDGVETLDFSPTGVPDYVVGDGGDTCSVDYGWIDASAGTAYNLDDDASTGVTLPWNFIFYGNSYGTSYLSSNGFVSFGSGYSKWHGIVPFEGTPNNQIIGLGEDLNPALGTQGKIYTRNMGDGRLVIQYDQVQHWASGNPETFEIILNQTDGSIVVQYKTLSWPDFANAGIENSDGSRGVQYSYANDLPLVNGLAIKYTAFTGQPPVCSPAVAPTLSNESNGTTAYLTWQHLAPNTSYQVWRGTVPYFLPPGEGALLQTLPAAAGTMSYSDPGMVGDPLTHHFWVVRGILAGGASGPSNRVGEFDFSLTRGN